MTSDTTPRLTDGSTAHNARLYPGPEWHREDGDGEPLGLHFAGHIDLDDAVTLAWAALIDWDFDIPGKVRRGGARHTWLRKVPWRDEDGWDGSFRYVFSGPGPGATPVTYIAFAHPWDSKPCHNWPRCHEPAAVGIPAARFSNAPAGVPYIYYCREHRDDFDRRWQQAIAEARASRLEPAA